MTRKNNQQQFVYPPTIWQCPSCKKDHMRTHFAFPDQIDESKKPGEKGRVKFDRENYCGSKKGDTENKYGVDKTGAAVNELEMPNPLFCPHCGWVDNLIYIIKKYTDCCIRGCPNAATHDKQGKYPTCDSHAGITVGGHPEGSE